MKLMSASEFEQVLHPIFQEDEFTLIVAGAFLGALAGFIQQCYETKNNSDDKSSEEPDMKNVLMRGNNLRRGIVLTQQMEISRELEDM
eukprot:gene33711-43405_t